MAGENMNKENNPNLSKRSVGEWSDSDDEAPPPKRATRGAKVKPQAEAPAKKKQPAKSRKKKTEVKEEVSDDLENVKDKAPSPLKRRTRAGRAKAAVAPKKEVKAKKSKAGLKSKYFKEETDDNGNNTPQQIESDEEAIPPPAKKTAKGRKKKASPKRKTVKAENESDWSESDNEDKPKQKAKPKKRGPKKTTEEKKEVQTGPQVEGTYLDDGTLQIEITEAKKNRFNEEYKETPEERNKREWAAYLRSIIAREKREHSQERHRIDLLVHLWLGMSWDKHIDCKFLQVNRNTLPLFH